MAHLLFRRTPTPRRDDGVTLVTWWGAPSTNSNDPTDVARRALHRDVEKDFLAESLDERHRDAVRRFGRDVVRTKAWAKKCADWDTVCSLRLNEKRRESLAVWLLKYGAPSAATLARMKRDVLAYNDAGVWPLRHVATLDVVQLFVFGETRAALADLDPAFRARLGFVPGLGGAVLVCAPQPLRIMIDASDPVE